MVLGTPVRDKNSHVFCSANCALSYHQKKDRFPWTSERVYEPRVDTSHKVHKKDQQVIPGTFPTGHRPLNQHDIGHLAHMRAIMKEGEKDPVEVFYMPVPQVEAGREVGQTKLFPPIPNDRH